MELAQSHTPGRGTVILAVATTLIAVGTVLVLSAEAGLDDSLLDLNPRPAPALRQAAFAAVGFGFMVAFGRMPRRLFRWRPGAECQPALLLVLLVAVLLLLVCVPGLGMVRNGARRWVTLGPLAFQPSEPAKLALVIFLAAWLSGPQRDPRRFRRTLLPAAAVAVVLIGLVGIEDFGTGVLLALVAAAMLLAAGCRWWHLAVLSLPAVAMLAALLIGRPYRLARLVTFRDVWADPHGSTYHPLQSLITIASGGWWGRGLGGGIQKYGYLPQGRSDFIFALLCEELGIIGGIVVIALLLVLLWQGRQAMVRSADSLGRLLACGITVLIGLQAAINIAVVTVVVPTKGIALPFVSAGGTGLLVFCAAVGMLAGIDRSSRLAPRPPS